TPDTFSASWSTGFSRDGGGEALKLGTVPNDRRNPNYYTAYYSFPKWCNQKLAAVDHIRASFLTPPGTTNYVGSPRLSLEVMNDDSTYSGDIIFLDPALIG